MVEWLIDKSLNLIGIPILTAVGVAVVSFFKSFASANEAKKHMKILDDLITSAVESENQKKVDSLKGTDEWTDEMQDKVFQDVKHRVMSLLTVKTQKVLSDSYVNFEQFIELRIEKIVKDVKYKKKKEVIC